MKIRTIQIDVARNDPVDIRCGGPQYLGFDFIVESKTKKYWDALLKNCNKKRPDFPYFDVSISRPFESSDRPRKLWSPKAIENEILKYVI